MFEAIKRSITSLNIQKATEESTYFCLSLKSISVPAFFFSSMMLCSGSCLHNYLHRSAKSEFLSSLEGAMKIFVGFDVTRLELCNCCNIHNGLSVHATFVVYLLMACSGRNTDKKTESKPLFYKSMEVCYKEIVN